MSVGSSISGGPGIVGPAGPINGSTGATDNRALRADGAGGITIQNSLVTIQDDGTVVVNAVLVYADGDLSNDEKIQLAASFLLASDVHIKFYNNVDISSGSAVVGLLRNAAANTLKITDGANGDGKLIIGGARFVGLTSAVGPPTTTELPSNKDFAIHIDTAAETVYLAYNNDGDIVKVALGA